MNFRDIFQRRIIWRILLDDIVECVERLEEFWKFLYSLFIDKIHETCSTSSLSSSFFCSNVENLDVFLLKLDAHEGVKCQEAGAFLNEIS